MISRRGNARTSVMLTVAQRAALDLLVHDGPVPGASATANGFASHRAVRSLIEMGLAEERGASAYAVTALGRRVFLGVES